MIGKYIDTILDEEIYHINLPPTHHVLEEVGAHGIEERGVYRIHQFEKQEMVIVCHQMTAINYLKNSLITLPISLKHWIFLYVI